MSKNKELARLEKVLALHRRNMQKAKDRGDAAGVRFEFSAMEDTKRLIRRAKLND